MQFCNGTHWVNMGAAVAGVEDGDKGDIAVSSSGAVWTIDVGAVTNTMLAGSIALSKLSITGAPDGSRFLRDDGVWAGVPGVSDGDKGSITVSNSGTVWTIDSGAVTDAMLAGSVALSKLSTTGTANSSTYLRGDGVWNTVSTGVSDGDKGSITVSSSGTVWTIDNTAVTNAMLAGSVALSKLSTTGTANNATFLRGDGTWALPVTTQTVDVQTFDSSSTWNKPATGGTLAIVECWGGGGSGAKRSSGTAHVRCMSGGGGGGYNMKILPLVSLGASETVTIGAGGAGQTTNNTNGNAGGNSSFGSHLIAYGGEGGKQAVGASYSSARGGGPSVNPDWKGGGAAGCSYNPDAGGSISSSSVEQTGFGGGFGGSCLSTCSGDAGSTSSHGVGGAGGAAATGSGNGGAGSVPGGAGGATYTGTASGAGAGGRCRTTVF